MLAVLGGVALALAHGPAPPPVELRWDAPPGCPGQGALELEVAALLADHDPSARTTPARLHFHVERRGSIWHLHGEITSSELSGRRRLSAATCDELLAAAALWTAIVVDPAVPDEPGEPAGRVEFPLCAAVSVGALAGRGIRGAGPRCGPA